MLAELAHVHRRRSLSRDWALFTHYGVEVVMSFVLPTTGGSDCFGDVGGSAPTLLGCLMQVTLRRGS